MSRSNPSDTASNPSTLVLIDYEPTGFCACGCGEKTLVPVRNVRSKNRFKGVPVEFAKGHYRRMLSTRGYKALIVNGLLKKVHRLRAEAALGKRLPNGAIVHHADGSKSADAPLVICQDSAYHSLLHRRMRVREAGGDPNTDRICQACREVRPLTDFYRSTSDVLGRGRACKRCDNKRRVARL